MARVDTQWALKSILELSHHHRRAHVAAAAAPCLSTSGQAMRVSALPRLLQTPDQSRILLLAKRPNGVAGVELGYGPRVPLSLSSSVLGAAADGKQARRVRLLAAYMQRRGFETTPPTSHFFTAAQPPLIVHANHLLAWKLNQSAAAFPLYAHTLAELQQLRRRELLTLQPGNCLVATAYSEWDNWREAVREPGWDVFSASDETLEQLLSNGVTAPLADEVDGVCRVDIS